MTVTAQPGSSSADQAVHIEVAGLGAGQQATVRVSSTDANGVPWVSSATYRADASGVVDPGLVAPLSGSYQGVSGMGLVWSMHQLGPVSPRPRGAPGRRRSRRTGSSATSGSRTPDRAAGRRSC